MIEVQDIFQRFGAGFIDVHRPPPHIQKVIRAIQNCRTAALGGHTDICNECGYNHVSYNSCRNRHCPKCQALSKERWIEARQRELLPVPYFHVVFTLPQELDAIVLQNQETLYNLLFKASQETIRELARDDKYLGAEIGLTAILHTWGQNLILHPHIHMIVPVGGLTPDSSTTLSHLSTEKTGMFTASAPLRRRTRFWNTSADIPTGLPFRTIVSSALRTVKFLSSGGIIMISAKQRL